jgi:hypothetical protein
MELEVTVEYDIGSNCEHYNGERLKLHILDIWAPVDKINRFYKATDTAVKKVLQDNNQL